MFLAVSFPEPPLDQVEPAEDDNGGFAHGGWSVICWDDQMDQVVDEATSTPFAIVLGRKTYDIAALVAAKRLRWPGNDETGARERAAPQCQAAGFNFRATPAGPVKNQKAEDPHDVVSTLSHDSQWLDIHDRCDESRP
jgi:hypothetical protein